MSRSPSCGVCKDTHRMLLDKERRYVPCTHCPMPCTLCVAENSPYCRSTPCKCICHSDKESEPQSELESLRTYKEDMENAIKGAMDEKCDLYEMHCTCVPVLRARIRQLELELNRQANQRPT